MLSQPLVTHGWCPERSTRGSSMVFDQYLISQFYCNKSTTFTMLARFWSWSLSEAMIAIVEASEKLEVEVF